MGSIETTLYIRLHRAIRELMRRARILRGVYGVPVSLPETHLMTEVEIRSDVTAVQLAEVLCADKSSVSRLLASMERRGLLTLERRSEDSRSNRIRLAKKGVKLLHAADEGGEALVERGLRGVPESDLVRFRNNLERISTALGAPLVMCRSNEHPLRPELRRFTRAIGIRGPDNRIEGISVSEAELLSALRDASRGLTILELAEDLLLQRTNTTAMLTALAKRGLVAKVGAPSARLAAYEITAQGRQRLERFESAFSDKMRGALAGVLELRELVHTVVLLDTLAKRSASPPPPLSEVRTVKQGDETVLNSAREFMVLEIARRRDFGALQPTLLHPENVAILLTIGFSIVGVCEVTLSGSKANVAHFFSNQTEFESTRMLREACDTVSRKAKVTKLIIPAQSQACLAGLYLGGRPTQSGGVELGTR